MVPIRNTDSEPSPEMLESSSGADDLIPASRPSSVAAARVSMMPSTNMLMHSALLSAVAGYVDAAGFASLLGLFPAHLTGELVGDAIAFSSGHARGHASRFWMFPVFVGSVVMATLVARVLRYRGRKALAGLLGLVTAALALFSMSDPLARLLHAHGHFQLLLSGGCAVAAMGFQSALMRESLTGSCPTTVMTGNLTQVVIEIVDEVFSKVMRETSQRSRSRLVSVGSALLAFVSCAVLGGWLIRACGSLSVLLPTAVTAILTMHAWREDRPLVSVQALKPARVPSFADSEFWPPETVSDQDLDSEVPEVERLADPASAARFKAERLVEPDAAPPSRRAALAGEHRRRIPK